MLLHDGRDITGQDRGTTPRFSYFMCQTVTVGNVYNKIIPAAYNYKKKNIIYYLKAKYLHVSKCKDINVIN